MPMLRNATGNTTVPGMTMQRGVALCALGLVVLAGCHAAPPRYQTTWERATSGCYQPNVYCHGFTPTTWTRWPEGCGPHEYVMVEEVAPPMVQPRVEEAPAPKIFEAPTPVPNGDASGIQIPSGAGNSKAKPRRPSAKPARHRQALSKSPSWQTAAQRYFTEVTSLR